MTTQRYIGSHFVDHYEVLSAPHLKQLDPHAPKMAIIQRAQHLLEDGRERLQALDAAPTTSHRVDVALAAFATRTGRQLPILQTMDVHLAERQRIESRMAAIVQARTVLTTDRQNYDKARSMMMMRGGAQVPGEPAGVGFGGR